MQMKKLILCAAVGLSLATLGAEEPFNVAVFGGSFSVIRPSQVAKDEWRKAFGCQVVDFGRGGMGFLNGAAKTNDIPNQIRKALASKRRFRAFVLWASTNDIHKYTPAQQNEAISNCVAMIRAGAPEAKVLFFASMPCPLRREMNAKLEAFVAGQLATCASLGVPCLDLYHDSGITAENAALYAGKDKFHPNEAGYARIAPLQVAFLRKHLVPSPCAAGAAETVVRAFAAADRINWSADLRTFDWDTGEFERD